ncbi:hypothetical protein BSKO_03431 [Bryopsis sp. KO-2023]|nr:hypothetical protein BSKO_03431 [Bryopsis sp. KO-2023]
MESSQHVRCSSLREVEFDAGADILSAPLGAQQEKRDSLFDVIPSQLNVLEERPSDWNEKLEEVDAPNGKGADNGGEIGAKKDADDIGAWNTYNEVSLGAPVNPTTSPNFSEIMPADENSESMPQSPTLNNMAVQIWVSNPKQVEEVSKLGMKSTYTSYFVKSQTSLQSYPFKERAVWRRFRDFDGLHRLLRSNHPGYFCPPLPNKDFLGAKRAKEDFVRVRQLDLQKFLRQIAQHPALMESRELKLFLGLPEELALSHEWADMLQSSVKTDVVVDEPGPKTPGTVLKKDFLKTMRKVGSSFKKDVLRQTKSVTDDEKRLKEAANRLRFLEVELGACCLKSRALVSAYESVTSEMLVMGKTFVSMARFEESAAQTCGQYTETGRFAAARAADMQKAGYATLRVHYFYRKFTQSAAGWMSLLEDHLNIVPAALAAMGDRQVALGSVHACEDQLESTRQRLDDLTRESTKKLGGLSNFSGKSAQLSAEINKLVAELGRLSEEYDRVRCINEEENAGLTKRRHKTLSGMVRGFAKDQAVLNESVAVAWKALSEQLGKSTMTNISSS